MSHMTYNKLKTPKNIFKTQCVVTESQQTFHKCHRTMLHRHKKTTAAMNNPQLNSIILSTHVTFLNHNTL
jgi:hypothetical protein